MAVYMLWSLCHISIIWFINDKWHIICRYNNCQNKSWKKSKVNIDEKHSKIRLVNTRLVSSFTFIKYPQHMYIWYEETNTIHIIYVYESFDTKVDSFNRLYNAWRLFNTSTPPAHSNTLYQLLDSDS